MLWNRVLSNITSRTKHIKVPFIKGEKLSFYTQRTELIKEIENINIPYVSEEAIKDSFPFKDELEKVISEEGIREKLSKEVAGLKAFNPGQRKAIIKPERLEIIYQERKSVTVRFFLPSGSYATILLRKALHLRV